MGIADEVAEKVRFKGESERLRKASIGSRSQNVSKTLDDDLRSATDIVTKAASTIATLACRNSELEALAADAIKHYKSEAEAANTRNAELQACIDRIENELQVRGSEFQRSVGDLQARLTKAKSELDEKAHEAEIAIDWLNYLANEIRTHLLSAPMRLTEMTQAISAHRSAFNLDRV